MGRIRSVILLPSLIWLILSVVLSLVGTLGDVPYVPCAAVAFLKISANVSSAFRFLIPVAGKGDAGNGFLSASVISMDDFVARNFDDNDSNWHCCGKTPFCHLFALLPSW